MTGPRSLLAAVLALSSAPVLAQIPCPGGIPTNCASPYYWDLHVLDAATLPGGYVTPSGLFTLLGVAQGGQILGAWPTIYLAPSPNFTGLPTVTGGPRAQMEFIRQNGVSGAFTFIGASPTLVGISSSENLPIQFCNNNYTCRMYIDPTFGNVGIGTTTPGARLDVAAQSIIVEQPFTPPSSGSFCTVGQISWDVNYVYVCVSGSTWKRSALSGGF